MADAAPEPFDVPVTGGVLRVHRWGRSGPRVLAAHGITASAMAFRALGERLAGDVTLLAPDLRGRGASGELPGPFGLAAHARDLVAVLDHVGAQRATALGHSMGAYVAVELALDFPERVERLVLADGGLPLPVPEDADVDEMVAATLGPALQRLLRTFPSREAYLDYWRDHPAFSQPGVWNAYVESYLHYDLTGQPGALRSRVSEEAVRTDGRDVFSNERLGRSLGRITCPVTLLRAARGLLDQPQPLLADEVVERYQAVLPQLTDQVVADTNHYTLTLGERGAEALAAHVRRAVGVV
ncbi:MAG TPA: alpha/beta fold hydrolase [Egibacteraceae bacterium]|nr:alpha/beta fold hydrolase [Egibacteraceae bacterium]